MGNKRIGMQTIQLMEKPRAAAWASVAGAKEGEGPLGDQFDRVLQDDLLGEKTWEMAESKMFEQCIRLALTKAAVMPEQVHFLIGGDLLNQIIAASFAARQLATPFLGLYGACSTMAESLCLGSMLIDGGMGDVAVCAASSHFCTAERQYRAPLELGTQRPPTAQWTVTGAGATLLRAAGQAQDARVCLTHVTLGKVVDLGIDDANNMGAAMAPAAADTLCAHLRDTGRAPEDYDLIVTGDLGSLGRQLMLELMRQAHTPVPEKRSMDCGMVIFAPEQDTHAGGSGCGCSAAVLNSTLMARLAEGQLKRVLFMATGALLSPVSSMQGETIPGIAHAVALEHVEGGA
ncbi:MAG: stage V sporulation protein AD [Oscillospiraceae bacterium]|jgi:stage V sporulation protein AD|nr:stage V sporulation protein AD [Oscillospiraceae bacterium]